MSEHINYEFLNEKQTISENDPFTLERYLQFSKHMPSGRLKVLDVGCNTGRGGMVLKKNNSELILVGLDCVKNRLERLPKALYDSYIYGFSTAINVSDDSFDAICAGEFIEHLVTKDVITSLIEFYRILRPNGVLLLTTPNPNYLRLKLTGGSVLGGAHLSQHRIEELSTTLNQIGFNSILVRGSGKVSRFLGENCPILSLYGSYLLCANK